MKSSMLKHQRASVLSRCALPLVLLWALCGAPAKAQLVVHDPTSFFSLYEQQLIQLEQLGHDVAQRRQQLTQLENAYTRLQGLLSGSFGVDSNLLSNLQLVDANAGVAERCPENGGGPAGFLSSVARRVLGVDEPVFKQQQQVCIATVQAENSRYNNIVQLMKRLDERNKKLEELRAETPGNNSTEGEVSGHQLKMEQHARSLEMDISASMAQSQIYDSLIASLNTQQVALGQQAFSGKPKTGIQSLTNAMVQGALLKAALEVGN